MGKIANNIEIIIDQEKKSDSSTWQEHCHNYYLLLKNNLDNVTLTPAEFQNEGKGERGDVIQIFSTIVAGLASPVVLTQLIEISKLWLNKNRGSQITIKLENGQELNLSGASEDELARIITIFSDNINPTKKERLD